MKILQINAVYKRLSTGMNVYEINTLHFLISHLNRAESISPVPAA